MEALSRETFLAADDRPLFKVEVPELGGFVYVRPMSAGEAQAFDGEATVTSMVADYTVDADGERLFTAEDVELLEKKSFKALNTIVQGVLDANGMGKEALEELEGN